MSDRFEKKVSMGDTYLPPHLRAVMQQRLGTWRQGLTYRTQGSLSKYDLDQLEKVAGELMAISWEKIESQTVPILVTLRDVLEDTDSSGRAEIPEWCTAEIARLLTLADEAERFFRKMGWL